MPKRNITIISSSPFPYGDNITDGPGFRAWVLFQELAKRHDVTILSLYESYHQTLSKEYDVSENSILVKCISHKPRRVARAITEEKPDVLYMPWSATPFISHLKARIPTVIDYVGPGLLENFASLGYIPAHLLRLKLHSFWLGDFLMTAGYRERYYLLGLFVASKRLSLNVQKVASPFIHVIPMTPPPEPPVMRKKIINRELDELIILLAGTFLPYYDYSTFFDAFKLLIRRGKTNFKIVIAGGNPRDLKFEETVRKMGQSLPKENVVFTGLVPFKERANLYLGADAGMNISPATLEDELSVRTRVIDYLWGRLPLITPARDEHSEMVTRHGAGFTYEVENPQSLAQVIEMLIEPSGRKKLKQARDNIEKLLKDHLNIINFIGPLEDFLNNPYVDPARLSTKQILPDIFLLARDTFRHLRRGI